MIKDLLINRYDDLGGAKFKMLSRMEIEVAQPSSLAEKTGEVTLSLELSAIGSEDTRKLYMTFRGVQNLRLTPPESSVIYLSQLSIINISDRQWENVNYIVEEKEDKTLSFACSSFDTRISP